MIKPLTSLRFCFALMVFVSHLDLIDSTNVNFNNVYNAVLQEGYLGVSFFFILSGFVLSLSYKQRLNENTTSFKGFYIARFARIYPLHLLTLILSIPVSLKALFVNKLIWFAAFALNVVLLQSFIPDRRVYFSFNSPSWSISDEGFFYLMFPFIIMLYYRYRKIPYLYLCLLILIPVGIHFIPFNSQYWLFDINPFFRIIDFLIGTLLYTLYESKAFDLFFKSVRRATLIETTSIILFILFLSFHKYIPRGYRWSCFYWIPMSSIVFVFAYSKGYISEFLSKKVFVLLGEVSFGFYLIHQLAIRYVMGANRKFLIISNDYVLIVVIFTSALIVSILSYYWIEKPANKYIKARFIR